MPTEALMSSLIFSASPSEVMLATDTLAVSDNIGTPKQFTTKFYIVPHLRGVICGTGLGQFIVDWFGIVNCDMAVRDFPQLNFHAPKALGELWDSKYKGFSITSTIYHFGFPANDGPLVTYAYRSTAGFVSDPLPHGIHLKPEGEVPKEPTFPTAFRGIMDSQRGRQSGKPIKERVFIGGEILVCHMTRSGYAVWTADRFPDYDENLLTMFQKISEAKETRA